MTACPIVHCFGAVDAFCAPQKPNNVPATLGLAELSYKTAHYEQARAYLKILPAATGSPAALLLGVCVERKLGDRQSELSYMQQLRNRYPESREAKQMQSGGCE